MHLRFLQAGPHTGLVQCATLAVSALRPGVKRNGYLASYHRWADRALQGAVLGREAVVRGVLALQAMGVLEEGIRHRVRDLVWQAGVRGHDPVLPAEPDHVFVLAIDGTGRHGAPAVANL